MASLKICQQRAPHRFYKHTLRGICFLLRPFYWGRSMPRCLDRHKTIAFTGSRPHLRTTTTPQNDVEGRNVSRVRVKINNHGKVPSWPSPVARVNNSKSAGSVQPRARTRANLRPPHFMPQFGSRKRLQKIPMSERQNRQKNEKETLKPTIDACFFFL